MPEGWPGIAEPGSGPDPRSSAVRLCAGGPGPHIDGAAGPAPSKRGCQCAVISSESGCPVVPASPMAPRPSYHFKLGMSCPSWQWHRTGSRWSPVRTLPVAPLWCDLGFFPNSRNNKAAAILRPRLNSNLNDTWDHASDHVARLAGPGAPAARPFKLHAGHCGVTQPECQAQAGTVTMLCSGRNQ